jgi:hypothetical protein
MIIISQWFCPRRHRSIALVWSDKVQSAEYIEAVGEDLFTRGVIIRRCGICGGDLHVEHVPTRFKTLEEAKPFLEECQKANLAARFILQNKN